MFHNKEYVYEVYKEMSFSKAAENMYISQPSLSLTIKKIENRLGTPLFDRSTTPIQLTDCGKEYIMCIEKIFDIENEFENYVSDLNNLKTGNLTIGASNIYASYILPPIITKFKSKYPKVQVDLIEADTAHLEKQLYEGTLDLIIDNYDFNNMDNIYKRHFFYKEQMILAVPEKLPHNKAGRKYRLTADDIIGNKHLDESTPSVPITLFKDAPFILLRQGNDTRDRAAKIFKEHQMKPNIILELDQLATAYNIACHGMGITLISDTSVKKISSNVGVYYYKIDSSHASREIYFYYRQNKYMTKAMKEFLSISIPQNAKYI